MPGRHALQDVPNIGQLVIMFNYLSSFLILFSVFLPIESLSVLQVICLPSGISLSSLS